MRAATFWALVQLVMMLIARWGLVAPRMELARLEHKKIVPNPAAHLSDTAAIVIRIRARFIKERVATSTDHALSKQHPNVTANIRVTARFARTLIARIPELVAMEKIAPLQLRIIAPVFIKAMEPIATRIRVLRVHHAIPARF
jgi:hypothetical protein